MFRHNAISGEHRLESSASQDEEVINASFETTPASYCEGCGVLCALRLSPRPCPVFAPSMDDTMRTGVDNMTGYTSASSIDLPRAIEENLPSYYEHLSLSLLAPETPEEMPSPRMRKRRMQQTSALPLPDHMTDIGDFLAGVVAYVEVRSDLGDHSGAIGTLLFRMGASIVATLSSSVTHAVLCSARSATVRKAQSMNVRIVAARWVMACKDQLRRVEEEDWPMLADTAEQRGVRQYRYKASGVNDTPSPMSVRNLALLCKSKRRHRMEYESLQDSPRQIWQSPRKSLRRILFTQANHVRLPETLDETDSEGDASALGVPETQEITEVPETQSLGMTPFVCVPDTDPASLMGVLPEVMPNGDESVEIPETQPNNIRYPQSPDAPSLENDFAQWSSPECSLLTKTPNLGSPSGEARHSQLDVDDSYLVGNDLEESFNSLSVNDRSFAHDQTFRRMREASGDGSDMAIEEKAEVACRDATADDSDDRWLPISPGIQMELTRVVELVPKNSVSRVIGPSVTMVLTQPVAMSKYSEELGEGFAELDGSLEPEPFNKHTTPSLELVLPQGASQNLSSDTPVKTETSTANTSTVLVNRRNNRVDNAEPTESANDSRRCDAVAQKPSTGFSEEIAMSWPSDKVKSAKPDPTLPPSFTSSAGGEKRASHAATSERQIERSMEKKELGLSKRTSLSLPKESSDVVTPIPDRMQARVSGVFSDDNSPCIESRRTIVFTAFKQKRSLIKGLQELSKSRGHFDIAKEVTTRTEIVVIGDHKRTLAVLLGISWGCWFVSPKWAIECINTGRWLKPKAFEVKDYLAPMVTNRMARTGHVDSSKAEIFHSLKVFISRRNVLQPPADALQRMVLQGGGKVVFDSRQAHVYVCLAKPAKKINCHCVTPTWVVESVAEGQVQPFDTFKL